MGRYKQANTFFVFLSGLFADRKSGFHGTYTEQSPSVYRMRPYPCYPPVDSQRYVRAFRGQPHFCIVWVVFIDGKVVLRKHCQQAIKKAGRKMTGFLFQECHAQTGLRSNMEYDSYGSLLLLCRKGRPEPNGHGLRLLQTSLPRFLQGSFLLIFIRILENIQHKITIPFTPFLTCRNA